MHIIRWGAATLLLVLSACSLGQAVDPGSNTGRGDSTGVGPGISIDQAIGSESNEPLLINGWLLISPEGEVRFCSTLGESSPPTCGGSSLVVDGLDPANTGELAEAGDVRWSVQSIQLLGSVENGRLIVSTTSL